MVPGDGCELPETSRGFRCSYSVHDTGLLVVVQERQIKRDLEGTKLVAFWFARSSVGIYFATSREQARFVVERHVGLYDEGLIATLLPIWEAWDRVELSSLQGDVPDRISNAIN